MHVYINNNLHEVKATEGEWELSVELEQGVNKVREVIENRTVDSITIYNMEMDDLQPIYSVKVDRTLVISGYSKAGQVVLEYGESEYAEETDHKGYFEFSVPLPPPDEDLILYSGTASNKSTSVEVDVEDHNIESLLTKMKQDYHMILDTIESDVYNDQLSASLLYKEAMQSMVSVLNTMLRERMTIPDLQPKVDELALYDLIYDQSASEDSSPSSNFEVSNGSPVSLSFPAMEDGEPALLLYMRSRPGDYEITVSESYSTTEEVRIINSGEYSAYVIDVSSIITDTTTPTTLDLSVNSSNTVFIDHDAKPKLLLNYRGEFD